MSFVCEAFVLYARRFACFAVFLFMFLYFAHFVLHRCLSREEKVDLVPKKKVD